MGEWLHFIKFFSSYFSRKSLVYTLFVSIIALSTLLIGQHCSRVNLERQEDGIVMESSENKFVMPPPTDFRVTHKYIFFIDMSNSMISGPCPQDVNANILFTVFPTFNVYDPNKLVGNRNDHRADATDCKVNPNLAINWKNITTSNPNMNAEPPTFYNTTLGVDHEGHRLALVRSWIQNVISSADKETLKSAQVMLVPVSGGISQKKLNAKLLALTGKTSALSFIPLTDPKVFKVLDFLLDEQNKNIEQVKSDDPERFFNTTMGTSSPGSLLKELYEVVYKDMYEQYKKDKLADSEYDFIQLTDGLITPTEKLFQDTLQFSALCSSCAVLRQTCSGACSKIVADMIDSWGNPVDNQIETMEFNFGLMQTLPNYFGAGIFRTHFVKLKKDRSLALWPNEKAFFDELKPLFAAKNRTVNIWESANADIPFKLPGTRNTNIDYKITDLFILNPNVRFNQNGVLDVDSDADGLFDNEEVSFGTNPTLSRTNGYCLDGFMKNKAFADRCNDLARSHSCDPQLDSDGDSLNECEELLLGTDAFDFDTDGDSIPDYFEWLYGFNPMVNDLQKDSNNDGIPNLVNFSNGLGPNYPLKQMKDSEHIQYELNQLGKMQITEPFFGLVLIDSYQLILRYVPTLRGLAINPQQQNELFLSRNLAISSGTSERKAIPTSSQLLVYPSSESNNEVIAFARVIDQNDISRVFWRVYKKNIKNGVVIKQPELDLSAFKQIKVLDKN